jgi:hypothetical protein
MSDLVEAAKAIARGEQPAPSISYRGHRYVPAADYGNLQSWVREVTLIAAAHTGGRTSGGAVHVRSPAMA